MKRSEGLDLEVLSSGARGLADVVVFPVRRYLESIGFVWLAISAQQAVSADLMSSAASLSLDWYLVPAL
jgi:hypothetical protein